MVEATVAFLLVVDCVTVEIFINITLRTVHDVVHGLSIFNTADLRYTFAIWIEVEPILPYELLKYHRQTHLQVVHLAFTFRNVEHGKDHLDQTVRAETTLVGLVKVLEAQELLEQQGHDLEIWLLVDFRLNILTALYSEMLDLTRALLRLIQGNIDIQHFCLLV